MFNLIDTYQAVKLFTLEVVASPLDEQIFSLRMLLAVYRLIQIVKWLSGATEEAVHALYFETTCTEERALELIDELGINGYPRRQLEAIRERTRTALNNIKQGFLIVSQKNGSTFLLEITAQNMKTQRMIGTVVLQWLNKLIHGPDNKTQVILSYENDRVNGTSIGYEKATNLGTFALDRTGLKSLTQTLKKLTDDSADIILVAPKDPKLIRTKMIQTLGDHVPIILTPRLDEHIWEQAILDKANFFQHTDIAGEVEILYKLKMMEREGELKWARGIDRVLQDLDRNAVGKLLISDDFGGIRHVYRCQHRDAVDVVRILDGNVEPPTTTLDDQGRECLLSSSNRLLEYLSSCDPWTWKVDTLIITKRTPSGTEFSNRGGIAAILKGAKGLC